MDPVVILEWSYSPAGLFEEPIFEKVGPSTDLKIDNGKVEARTPTSAYDTDPALGDALHDWVENYFRATQVLASRGTRTGSDAKPSTASGQCTAKL